MTRGRRTVAQEVAEHAEPVVEPQEETADIEEVAETAEVVVAEPEVVTQPAAPVVAEVAAEVETVAAVEPEITVEHNHATAPMTRAIFQCDNFCSFVNELSEGKRYDRLK